MKVKIGNNIYDSNKEPIMIILSKEDKHNISNMDSQSFGYCSYPEKYTIEEIEEFMKI